jgi:hypothetical protein
MAEAGAILFILLLLLCWATNFFSLPANWINLLFLALWKWTHADTMEGGWLFFGVLALLAAVAEVIEFFSQVWGAKRYGATGKGSWGAFLGALAGALFGAPFFFGIGALVGAVAGAFAGSLLLELLSGRVPSEALRASKGAMFGRILGFVAKAGFGMVMISLSVPRIWPG